MKMNGGGNSLTSEKAVNVHLWRPANEIFAKVGNSRPLLDTFRNHSASRFDVSPRAQSARVNYKTTSAVVITGGTTKKTGDTNWRSWRVKLRLLLTSSSGSDPFRRNGNLSVFLCVGHFLIWSHSSTHVKQRSCPRWRNLLH